MIPGDSDPVTPGTDTPMTPDADDPKIPGDVSRGSGWHLGTLLGVLMTLFSSPDIRLS